jgi:hypothetical protein
VRPTAGLLAILSVPYGAYVPALQGYSLRKKRKEGKVSKERRSRRDTSERLVVTRA